jgi:hypothetical protein
MAALDILRSLDHAAGLSRSSVAAIVERALRQMLGGIDLPMIDEAIRAGDADPIIRAAKAWSTLASIIAEAFDPAVLGKSYFGAARGAVREAKTWASVDLVPLKDRAAAYLEERGAQLVAQVSETTRKAIRELVKKTFTGPEDFRDVARGLLRRKEFGLASTGQASHLKFVRELPDDLTRQERALRSGKNFYDLRRKRARLIGKTEGYNAGNEGRVGVYQEAIDQGVIEADAYLLQWITRGLNVCPRCLALDRITRKVKAGVFVSRPVKGGKFNGKVIRVSLPTVHPDCYCGVRSIRAEDAPKP